MPELHDLMDGVARDLTAVRWPPAAELRRRVRRRRQRVVAAAVALVTALTAGTASLARPDRDPPPPPATTPTPTADAGPAEIPRSALLRPGDAGAGPDTQHDGVSAFEPIRFETILDLCFRKRSPEMVALRTRYSLRQTLLLGTEGDRPADPYVLGQSVYRLSAPQVSTFVGDLNAAIEECRGFTQTGEIERAGRKLEVFGRHDWSVAADSFAGDESILVRHDILARSMETNEVVDTSFQLSVYVRVGDLVTVLDLRPHTALDELWRISDVAAQRLCAAAHPPC